MLRLRIRCGTSEPGVYHLACARATIGRDPSNDVVLADPCLSRTHLEFELEEGVWRVRDSASRNGSRLNGAKLSGNPPLKAGDEIAAGSALIQVLATGTEGTQVPPATELTRTIGTTLSAGEGVAVPLAGPGLDLVGTSAAIERARSLLERVARSTATVLLRGETGTGKEIAARLLHELSPRSAIPFHVMNCPRYGDDNLVDAELFGIERSVATGVAARLGLLERADRGTLFLDEVADLGLSTQGKLLRFLEDREVQRLGSRTSRKVDVRIVAATHKDLEAAIDAGRFRYDLLCRLNVIAITMPALRDRREDVPGLVRHLCARLGESRPLTAGAIEWLEGQEWRENVRGLRNALERASLLATGREITVADLAGGEVGAGAETAAAHGGEASQTLPLLQPLAEGPPPAPGADALPADPVDCLYQELTSRPGSFWALVREPFLRRTISRETVRGVIRRAYREGGDSYKGAAGLFGIEPEHKRLLDFLRRHGLGARPDESGPSAPVA